MRELSLFSGAGGGLLGTHLLGWRPVGYVEIDDYCQRVLAARIRDGILPEAPIFGDIRAFICDWYAASYTGLVDVVSAGFPCQPFSLAGRRQGEMDERNMWPATLDVLGIVRPQWALLENVPGLLASGYFGTILSDLAEAGFDARWEIISAAEVGAPHLRKRLWIVANAISDRRRERRNNYKKHDRPELASGSEHAEDVAIATGERCGKEGGLRRDESAKRVTGGGQDVSGADEAGLSNRVSKTTQPVIEFKRPTWWAVEPGVCRVVNGLARRVDRLKATGNGQVAAVVREAWRRLTT